MAAGNLRHDVIAEAELDGGHADVAAALESWRPCSIKDCQHHPTPTVLAITFAAGHDNYVPALLGNERRT